MYNVAGLDRLILRLGHLLGAEHQCIEVRCTVPLQGHFCAHLAENPPQSTKDGDLFRLRTPSGAFYEFPVVSTHTYLGTRVSIRTPGPKRCNTVCSWLSWNARLRPLVCSKRGLFLQDRVRIWRSSVPATLLYGLASGLPVGGLVTIRA